MYNLENKDKDEHGLIADPLAAATVRGGVSAIEGNGGRESETDAQKLERFTKMATDIDARIGLLDNNVSRPKINANNPADMERLVAELLALEKQTMERVAPETYRELMGGIVKGALFTGAAVAASSAASADKGDRAMMPAGAGAGVFAMSEQEKQQNPQKISFNKELEEIIAQANRKEPLMLASVGVTDPKEISERALGQLAYNNLSLPEPKVAASRSDGIQLSRPG